MFRIMIALAQGLFFNAYFFAYMISPNICHRFVGYLEEEAVHTYSVLLESLDAGYLKHWEKTPAPPEAIEYYNLAPDAMMRDLILMVRADESCHREVNHHFADLQSYEPIDHLHVEICDDKNQLKFTSSENKPAEIEAEKKL
jgi:ubiquinol oxidase